MTEPTTMATLTQDARLDLEQALLAGWVGDEPAGGRSVEIDTWGASPGVGIRVAAITYIDGNNTSSYHQTEPDHATVIFLCERALLYMTWPSYDCADPADPAEQATVAAGYRASFLDHMHGLRTPPGDLQVLRMLDLSLDHVPSHLRDDLNGEPNVIAHATRYGHLLWVGTDEAWSERFGNRSEPTDPHVVAIHQLAWDRGCAYVLLDSDGPTTDLLPTFEDAL